MEHLSDALVSAHEDAPGRKSRYSVHELPDGFRIEGRDRPPVEVRLSVTRTTLEVSTHDGEFYHSAAVFGLYAYPTLLAQVSWGLMRHWQGPPEAGSWSGARQWAEKQTARAISYRLYGQWQRLLSLVPEPKREVAKAVFAATFSPEQGCETVEELYEHPYLVSDIIRYRAAAIACRYAMELVYQAGVLLWHHPTPPPERSAEFEARLGPLFRHIASYGASHARYAFLTQPLLLPPLIELLARDWKGLLAGNGVASRSLSRTLMHLPGGVVRDLVYLPYVASALPRPVVDRVELLTVLHLGRSVARRVLPPPWLLSLVMQSQRADILTALRRLETHWHRPLASNRLAVSELVIFLEDYVAGAGEQPHRGTIVGLMDKAIRWHRAEQQEHLRRQLARYDTEAQAALPPLPLPTNPAVWLLRTVGEVVLEGETMQHCIASYADQAVAGTCYLFHVEHNGASASVMVDALGQVVQAYGSHNSLTHAAAYGRQVLARWGRGMRGTSTAPEQEHILIDPWA